MFSQIATRIALVLAGMVSLVIGLKLVTMFLGNVFGASLMHSLTAAASLLWSYLTPGLTALLALLMLAGLWWLFLGRRGRR
jgi:hypothetical protein